VRSCAIQNHDDQSNGIKQCRFRRRNNLLTPRRTTRESKKCHTAMKRQKEKSDDNRCTMLLIFYSDELTASAINRYYHLMVHFISNHRNHDLITVSFLPSFLFKIQLNYFPCIGRVALPVFPRMHIIGTYFTRIFYVILVGTKFFSLSLVKKLNKRRK